MYLSNAKKLFFLLVVAFGLGVQVNGWDLEEGEYFIYNRLFKQSRIGQYGYGHGDICTYDYGFAPDQLWSFERAPQHGWYYIRNAEFSNYRMAKWGDGDKDMGIYDGAYDSNQMWRPYPTSDGYFRIGNYDYPHAQLRKWGPGDSDFGTCSGCPYNWWSVQWEIIPRFKPASVVLLPVYSLDNRNGVEDVEAGFTLTTGTEISSSQSLRSLVGFDVSMSYSLSAGLEGIGQTESSVSVAIRTEFERTITTTTTQSSVETRQVTITVPVGSNVQVLQQVIYIDCNDDKGIGYSEHYAFQDVGFIVEEI